MATRVCHLEVCTPQIVLRGEVSFGSISGRKQSCRWLYEAEGCDEAGRCDEAVRPAGIVSQRKKAALNEDARGIKGEEKQEYE